MENKDPFTLTLPSTQTPIEHSNNEAKELCAHI